MKKIKCEFTEQELLDLWTALLIWLEECPFDKKVIQNLIRKVRRYLGYEV